MILALAGCNQIYSLDATKGRDAAPKEFFDAPPDAPFACPGVGAEPRFKPTFSQLPVGSCGSYTPSLDTGMAVASCNSNTGGGIAEGPIDGALKIVIPTSVRTLIEPRLFPEGDRMFVKDLVANRIDIYSRGGSTWSFTSTLVANPGELWISNPSRGPDRRAIVIEFINVTGYVITEYVEQAGTWVAEPSYKLNANFGYLPSLSRDGLRLVFTAQGQGLFFASRATLADQFVTVIPLTTAPKQASSPFLDEDCSKIYFSALDTVLFLEQE